MIEHGCNGGQLVDAVRELQSMVGDLRVRVDAIAPRAGAENDELIGRMDWCIKWATMGEATRQVMIDARALLAAPVAPRADADTAGQYAQACLSQQIEVDHEIDPRLDEAYNKACADCAEAVRSIADAAGASNERADCQKSCAAPFVCNRSGKCQMNNMKAQGFVHVTSTPERADAEGQRSPADAVYKDTALTNDELLMYADDFGIPAVLSDSIIIQYARAILAAKDSAPSEARGKEKKS